MDDVIHSADVVQLFDLKVAFESVLVAAIGAKNEANRLSKTVDFPERGIYSSILDRTAAVQRKHDVVATIARFDTVLDPLDISRLTCSSLI